MKKISQIIGLICLFVQVSISQTIPNPPKTPTIITDQNGNNKADPGDKIRYKTVISNTAPSWRNY